MIFQKNVATYKLLRFFLFFIQDDDVGMYIVYWVQEQYAIIFTPFNYHSIDFRDKQKSFERHVLGCRSILPCLLSAEFWMCRSSGFDVAREFSLALIN